MFPGVFYKDITDFDPKKSIKDMNKWFADMFKARDGVVSLDIEKNGWSSIGWGRASKSANLFQFSWY